MHVSLECTFANALGLSALQRLLAAVEQSRHTDSLQDIYAEETYDGFPLKVCGSPACHFGES